jgi:uncharacterized protein YciI
MELHRYVYVLKLRPDLQDAAGWTEKEEATVARHYEYLERLLAAGTLILAGKTDGLDAKTFGLVIFEAGSEKEARDIMAADPAVESGVMSAELHPYTIALAREFKVKETQASPAVTSAPSTASWKDLAVTALLILLSWLPLRFLAVHLDALHDPTGSLLLALVPTAYAFFLSCHFIFRRGKPLHALYSLLLNGLSFLYLIILPQRQPSQTWTNAFLFMLVILWFFTWLAHAGFDLRDRKRCVGFVALTGDVVVLSALLLLGGLVLIGLAFMLFGTIRSDEAMFEFIARNFVTLGLCAAPFVSLRVLERFPRLHLSRLLAGIFLPLFSALILVFGVYSLFSGRKPWDNRDVFIAYNMMLVIVVALLVFTGISRPGGRLVRLMSLILIAMTSALDLVTLAATVYRISSYGFTPNKLTLLVLNLAMLGNLAHIARTLLAKDSAGGDESEAGIADAEARSGKLVAYLPVYALVAILVTFVFPHLFGYV